MGHLYHGKLLVSVSHNQRVKSYGSTTQCPKDDRCEGMVRSPKDECSWMRSSWLSENWGWHNVGNPGDLSWSALCTLNQLPPTGGFRSENDDQPVHLGYPLFNTPICLSPKNVGVVHRFSFLKQFPQQVDMSLMFHHQRTKRGPDHQM